MALCLLWVGVLLFAGLLQRLVALLPWVAAAACAVRAGSAGGSWVGSGSASASGSAGFPPPLLCRPSPALPAFLLPARAFSSPLSLLPRRRALCRVGGSCPALSPPRPLVGAVLRPPAPAVPRCLNVGRLSPAARLRRLGRGRGELVGLQPLANRHSAGLSCGTVRGSMHRGERVGPQPLAANFLMSSYHGETQTVPAGVVTYFPE